MRPETAGATTALTPAEAETASVTPVWVVWWEEPDRSWESICTSLPECEKEYETRQADHLLKHWGKVGKRDQQSLLEWLESHLRNVPAGSASNFVNPAKEILGKVSTGASGPVIVQTW